jgi:hypothetical protein
LSLFGKGLATNFLGKEESDAILRCMSRGASLNKTSPRGKLKRFRVLHVGEGCFYRNFDDDICVFGFEIR